MEQYTQIKNTSFVQVLCGVAALKLQQRQFLISFSNRPFAKYFNYNHLTYSILHQLKYQQVKVSNIYFALHEERKCNDFTSIDDKANFVVTRNIKRQA